MLSIDEWSRNGAIRSKLGCKDGSYAAREESHLKLQRRIQAQHWRHFAKVQAELLGRHQPRLHRQIYRLCQRWCLNKIQAGLQGWRIYARHRRKKQRHYHRWHLTTIQARHPRQGEGQTVSLLNIRHRPMTVFQSKLIKVIQYNVGVETTLASDQSPSWVRAPSTKVN